MKRERFRTQRLLQRESFYRVPWNQEFLKAKALGQDTLMVISHLYGYSAWILLENKTASYRDRNSRHLFLPALLHLKPRYGLGFRNISRYVSSLPLCSLLLNGIQHLTVQGQILTQLSSIGAHILLSSSDQFH